MLKRLIAPLVLAFSIAACTTPTETTPLQVTDLVPADGATGVAVDVVLSATFNLGIDVDTLDGSFVLETEGGDEVAGVIDYDATTRTATFTPNEDLAFETTYVATVSGDVATETGVQLAGEASWSFTTLADPNVDPNDPPPLVTAAYANTTVVQNRDAVALSANASGGEGALSYALTSGTLPAGVTLNAGTGAIAGTPSAAGVFSGVVTVSDEAEQSADLAYTIDVVEALVGDGDYAPFAGDATVTVQDDEGALVAAEPFTIAFPAFTGGRGPFTYALTSGALPADFVVADGVTWDEATTFTTYAVELDAATGEISGLTGRPGLFEGEVTVTDAFGQTFVASFELDLELVLNVATSDLTGTQDTFTYEEGAIDFAIVPGDRIQVSGVANTDFLDPAFLDDLAFALVFIAGTPEPSVAEQGSFVINTGQGAVSRVVDVATTTGWLYTIVMNHVESGKATTFPVTFYLEGTTPPDFVE
jgi:hypothetical protein